MKRGQLVKCIECPGGEFTVGKSYEVLAGEGDDNLSIHGTRVGSAGMCLRNDRGGVSYCLHPSCVYGKWETV